MLATALIKLAPEDLEFAEIPIGGLPLYIPTMATTTQRRAGSSRPRSSGRPGHGDPWRRIKPERLPVSPTHPPGYGTPTVRENSMTAEKEPEVKAVLARRQEFDTDLHPAGSP